MQALKSSTYVQNRKISPSFLIFRKIVGEERKKDMCRDKSRKKLFESSLSYICLFIPQGGKGESDVSVIAILSSANLFNALNGQLRRLNCFVKSVKAPSWFLFVFLVFFFSLSLSPCLSICLSLVHFYSRRQ